jgi:nucleotide-binding universal stress UspA family protein
MKMAKIVVGYDGSKCSLEALRWSMAEAAAHNSQLSVVTVVEPRVVPSTTTAAVWAPPPESDVAAARQRAEDAVAKIATEVTPPAQVDVRTVVGHTGKTLVDAATDADQLVVGSHGRSALECALLGSVSMFAVHHGRCPVTVVRSAD